MKINLHDWKELTEPQREILFRRSGEDVSQVRPAVARIIEEVENRGDAALRDFTREFDRVDLGDLPLEVTGEEFRIAEESLDPAMKEALDYCIENTRRFHARQVPEAMSLGEIRPGLYAGERAVPLASVGLYIPRGRGSFPSMLYMTALPAQLAGVGEIVVVTPPNPDGSVDPACLYTARRCGVTRVFRVGGAQAIAALALGTESVPRVIKLSGPGSRYVAAAKELLRDRIEVGLPAGPSESIILADGSADPEKVALDLMVEAEHGSDSAALLFTPSRDLAEKTAQWIQKLTEEIPEPRKQFLTDVFSGYGGIIVTETLEEAARLVNRYAPEHLLIQTKDPFEVLGWVQDAGEILLGSHIPFSVANYATGVNAVLPTGGGARTYSAVSVRDFIKYNSVVYLTEEGLKGAAGPVKTMADYEGFITHGNAVKKRGL